jgi:hypothetical protein
MPGPVIWGSARHLLSGDVADTVEVGNLAALRSTLGAGPALVLADPAKLEAERQQVEGWLQGEGASHVMLVAVTDHETADDVFGRLPFVADVLARPVSPARLKRKLESALEVIRNRQIIRALQEALCRKSGELMGLNEIGVALSAERSIDTLLERILAKSREITGADAGNLYLVERGDINGVNRAEHLCVKLAQNDSLSLPLEEVTLPLDGRSIPGYAAWRGEIINAPDVYTYDPRPDSPFRTSGAIDEKFGYRTKSMLIVPMCDHQSEVIGLIQLINKKRNPNTILTPAEVEEEVIPFKSPDEEVVASLTSQASVALMNATLIQRLEREGLLPAPDSKRFRH